MRLTPDEVGLLRALYILREDHGVSAVNVQVCRDSKDEIVAVHIPPGVNSHSSEVTYLHKGVDMRVIDPLLHAGFIATRSGCDIAARLWITEEGITAVEHNTKPVTPVQLSPRPHRRRCRGESR